VGPTVGMEVLEGRKMCVTLGFRDEVDKKCALLVYYSASGGNFLSKFRDNTSVPSSRSSDDACRWKPIGCPKTSVRNYH